MREHIGFNKPYLTGKESEYIIDAVASCKISGDGKYTELCHDFFQNNYGFKKCLLTTSCTDALEMAAILINIKEGDEVIAPSYTFVSTVNAFVLRGAKIVFCDSREDHPGMDEDLIESLITDKTKAIVPVHYAGVSCDMDKIMAIADKYELFVIEDAAQAINSFYQGKDGVKKPLGSIGHMSTFSFHETKNIISGEGGMLVLNDEQFFERAEIIREKGTNRTKFFKGEIDKYGWVDMGSSFLPSDIIAAFLFAQLEKLNEIQDKRIGIWESYNSGLSSLEEQGKIQLPNIPSYAFNNAHMFYFCCNSLKQRDELIQYLKSHDVVAVFHYLSLHKSEYYLRTNDLKHLHWSEHYEESLVRLPFYYSLSNIDLNYVLQLIFSFFKNEA
jgi:dTDP-4-amino-4,6-dideoxygalactose transaminase